MREFDVVLDTSAIVCVLEDEPGADLVEERLAAARAQKIRLGASCVSLVEVYYKAHQYDGPAHASGLISTIKSWPIEFVYPDEALCLAAGELKASFRLSFADAFVAATAQQAGALLLHKDPEFEALRGMVKLHALPYKSRR
ncbi:type II toxin-antitoxin system VapC family toxin [soil metagenome]